MLIELNQWSSYTTILKQLSLSDFFCLFTSTNWCLYVYY